MVRLCECGCGQPVAKLGNRFVHGHNGRGKHYHLNQIAWNKGLNKEVDSRVRKNAERTSIGVKRLFRDPEYLGRYYEGRKNMKKIVPWNKGLTKETSERVRQNAENTSKGVLALYRDPEYSARVKATISSPEAVAKRSEKTRGRKRTAEQRRYMASRAWNRGLTKETDKRIARSAVKTSRTMKRKFLDKEFCRQWGIDRKVKPNKLEIEFQAFLDALFPGEYKYVGDFQYFIGGKNPDYTNVDGQKKLIEFFGDYWHQEDDPQQRIGHFKQYGFDTLIIWESEFLNNKDQIKQQLKEFHEV